MKRAVFACLVAGVLAANTGCGVLHAILWCPFGPGTMCDPTNCYGDGCGTCGCDVPCGSGCWGVPCGPACGPACGPPCDPCCDTCSDPCGDACCDACPAPCCSACGDPCYDPCWGGCGLLSSLFQPFAWSGCDAGCGEVYWGDFHGDPPDCCDPCDDCANWTGRGCATGGCVAGGCATGGYAGGHSGNRVAGDGGLHQAPRIISQTEHLVEPASVSRPTPAPQAPQALRPVPTRR